MSPTVYRTMFYFFQAQARCDLRRGVPFDEVWARFNAGVEQLRRDSLADEHNWDTEATAPVLDDLD